MDKEQIIINGVNVSGCKCYNKNIKTDCLLYPLQPDACKNNPNCYFKQLARKTQEYEELKSESFTREGLITLQEKDIDRYREALEEIEGVVKEMHSICIEEISITASQLNDRIYRESCERFKQILDIINKAKGKNQ